MGMTQYEWATDYITRYEAYLKSLGTQANTDAPVIGGVKQELYILAKAIAYEIEMDLI